MIAAFARRKPRVQIPLGPLLLFSFTSRGYEDRFVYGKCLNLAFVFGSDILNLTWANNKKEGLVKLLILFVVPIY